MGYTVEKRIVDENVVITQRVVDSNGRATVDRIVDMIEAGHTPGARCRRPSMRSALGPCGWALDYPGRPPGRHEPRLLRRHRPPQLIEQERWQRLNDGLQRLDPAADQARKGGRPAGDTYMLAGLAFCRSCGAPMRSKTYRTGTRT
jgi:hypothetical protein